MKKILLVLTAVLVVCFAASGALAYTINNITEVQWSNDLHWSSAATNPIDSPSPPGPNFATAGANWNAATSTLTIFSNWGDARDGYLGVTTADLFIDTNCDMTWDFSIGLDGNPNGQGLNRIGNKYTGVIQYTSAAGIYGLQARYPFPAAPIPVFMANQEANVVVPVTWGPGDANAVYSVAVNLTGLVGNQFCFEWATANCGNGPIEGKVPLPGAVLLLGAGMVRLVAYARRRQED